jgi:hypothetical protein
VKYLVFFCGYNCFRKTFEWEFVMGTQDEQRIDAMVKTTLREMRDWSEIERTPQNVHTFAAKKLDFPLTEAEVEGALQRKLAAELRALPFEEYVADFKLLLISGKFLGRSIAIKPWKLFTGCSISMALLICSMSKRTSAQICTPGVGYVWSVHIRTPLVSRCVDVAGTCGQPESTIYVNH